MPRGRPALARILASALLAGCYTRARGQRRLDVQLTVESVFMFIAALGGFNAIAASQRSSR